MSFIRTPLTHAIEKETFLVSWVRGILPGINQSIALNNNWERREDDRGASVLGFAKRLWKEEHCFKRYLCAFTRRTITCKNHLAWQGSGWSWVEQIWLQQCRQGETGWWTYPCWLFIVSRDSNKKKRCLKCVFFGHGSKVPWCVECGDCIKIPVRD